VGLRHFDDRNVIQRFHAELIHGNPLNSIQPFEPAHRKFLAVYFHVQLVVPTLELVDLRLGSRVSNVLPDNLAGQRTAQEDPQQEEKDRSRRNGRSGGKESIPEPVQDPFPAYRRPVTSSIFSNVSLVAHQIVSPVLFAGSPNPETGRCLYLRRLRMKLKRESGDWFIYEYVHEYI
jgi:hypothetical protein